MNKLCISTPTVFKRALCSLTGIIGVPLIVFGTTHLLIQNAKKQIEKPITRRKDILVAPERDYIIQKPT